MDDAKLPVAERLLRLLQHLGIERAHVAGAVPDDWRGLATGYADRVASLTLVCPSGLDPTALAGVASRSLLFLGDRGPTAERVRAGVAGAPGASLIALSDYQGLLLEDPASERGDEIVSALLDFVERQDAPRSLGSREGAGEVAGLSYRIEGSGAPLLLLPLALAPSQWEPGERVINVGCGSGVIDRWLAERSQRAHPITSVDINRYLLREAEALVRKAGLEDAPPAGGACFPRSAHKWTEALLLRPGGNPRRSSYARRSASTCRAPKAIRASSSAPTQWL